MFRATEPQVLFRAQLYTANYGAYDVAPGGDRFLVVEKAAQSAPISFFTNWEQALEGR